MAEYIEREAAIATACKGCNKDFPNEPCEPADCTIQQGLFKIPAADVVEVRHGEWVGDAFCDVLTCKECSYEHALYVLGKLSATNYCPNCGAKMDGKGEGE